MSTPTNNQPPSRGPALAPIAESAVKTLIESILKLPTFNEALASLREEIIKENPRDVEVILPKLEMDMDAYVLYGTSGYKYTKHALHQLVSRIKPEGVVGMAGYLAACPPELRSLNYNYWHTERFGGGDGSLKQENAVLRTRDDGSEYPLIRGVVSKSYVPIDDLPLMTRLALVLPNRDIARMRVARGDLHSRFMIAWPNMTMEIAKDDPVEVAMYMRTSETGVSSIWVEPLIYVASFGGSLILPMKDPEVRIRHVGEAQEKLSVAMAKVLERTGPFIIQLKEATEDSIENATVDLNALFEALAKAFEFSREKIEYIRREFDAIHATTRAGLAGAIVRAANYFDINTGEEMQRAAGQLIYTGWKKLGRF